MDYEEFKKLRPGTKITESELEEVRAHIATSKATRQGVPTGCICKECGIEYFILEQDIRTLVARMDRATGQPVKNYTDINCGCGTIAIREFLSK